MDAWSQWNSAQRGTTAAVTAPTFQPPGAYPGATAAAGGLAAPVPPAGAVPPAPGAPVGGYPMGYPYYGSTMPSAGVPGYNAQWATMGAQQQNWQQWEQWQQQYAQWHQQYGSKYQEQMAAMQALPAVAAVPPASVPSTTPSTLTPQIGSGDQRKDTLQPSTDPYSQLKSAEDSKSAGPSAGDKRPLDDVGGVGGRGDSAPSDSKKSKSSDSKKETLEELIEAEKAFDVQFKNWESQFDKWKEQNVNHPDKTQYREYESKWESWREQLLQKREQMKKKREAKMEELKQESAKADAVSSSIQSSAATTTTTTMPPMGPVGFPAPGQPAPTGFPPMLTGPPPMFGTPFGGYNNQPPYGSPMAAPAQQPPFMMNSAQGPPPPPNLYPGMNMPPPMMNMGMPPMTSQPPPDVVNNSQDKQNKPSFDKPNVDPQSNNAPLSFAAGNQGNNKGIPGLDLLNSGNTSQGRGSVDTSTTGSGRGGGYQDPLNKSQPLLKTSDDCKAFDFPKNDQPSSGSNQNFGSRFSGGPNTGPGSQSSFGQSPYGGNQNLYGNMQQPPSFSQFNLPPPNKSGASGGQFGNFDSFKNKPGIPSLMDGFDSNRGPPPGLMDKKDDQDDNRRSRFDEDIRGGGGSTTGPEPKFSRPGSRWSGGNDSPAKNPSRWGEPDNNPDESTSFSRGSMGSRGEIPDRFKSPGGPNDDNDRFSGPRGGNFRDKFPPRGGQFDRPIGDFDSRPPFDSKFGPAGSRDVDDRPNDGPGRFGGPNKFGNRRFDDQNEDDDGPFGSRDDDRFMGPRGGPGFSGRQDFGDRFSGQRGGPDNNDMEDRPSGFNDGPDRFQGPGGSDDGPDRFGGGRGFGDRNDRFFGSGPGDNMNKFPVRRGANDNPDRFGSRFGGGSVGLLGDAPDHFRGPDNTNDPDNIDDRDGGGRFFRGSSDGGSRGGGFGNKFGGPRPGFDGPGGFNKGGFGSRGPGQGMPPGGRFGGPNDRPFDDRQGFGGPDDGPGDMPGDRFGGPRFNDPQDSPGRFGLDIRGKGGDGPAPGNKGPVSLLDLPPIKPPPLMDSDVAAPIQSRGRNDDFDGDRFASPRSWGGGGTGPGPGPGSGPNDGPRNWGGGNSGPSPNESPDNWRNSRFSGPGGPGPGPSPDHLPDWRRGGGGGGGGGSNISGGGCPPPFLQEKDKPWNDDPQAVVVDYGHLPAKKLSSDFDEPETLEPIRTYDYEHGSKRVAVGGGSRWGPPDMGGRDLRMGGNVRERGNVGREDRFRGPPPRGGRDGNFRDNRGPPMGRDDKFNKDDRDNDKFRNNNSDFDNRKGGPNRNRSQNNRDRSSDENTKHSQIHEPKQPPVLIEDILSNANRANRPPKIIIILRGPPGSGKTFVAKLIKDKEVEMGGSAPRILSLDDYFIVETEKEEKDPETGRKVNKKVMEYEYEAGMEEHYRVSLLKAFKKTISDGYFPFIIVDCVNDKIKHYDEICTFGKQNGFQVYITEMDMDVGLCSKRNIHKRTEKDIDNIVKHWEPTPSSQTVLDVRSLLQSAAITEVDMEDSTQDDTTGNDQKNTGDNLNRSGQDVKEGQGDDKDKTEKKGNWPPRNFVRPRGDDNAPTETNPTILKRREKQIGYVKNMKEYIKYKEIIPVEKRQEFHPMTPDHTKQMSRRGFDRVIDQWKDHIKEWWNNEGHGLNYIRDYVKNSGGNSNNPEDKPPTEGQEKQQ